MAAEQICVGRFDQISDSAEDFWLQASFFWLTVRSGGRFGCVQLQNSVYRDSGKTRDSFERMIRFVGANVVSAGVNL